MDNIGENTIFEDSLGNLEILGPNGYIRILAEERRQMASRVGKQRPKMMCTFCGTPIPAGFECAKCHEKAERAGEPIYTWSILKNGAVFKSGKSTKVDAYKSLWAAADKARAIHWNYAEAYYYDEKGNTFALRILSEVQLPSETMKVDRIFADA